jgi:hypothetical protein
VASIHPPTKARLRTVGLALLVLWTGFGFGREVLRAAIAWHGRATYRTVTILWRFDTVQTERLQRCLDAATAVMPAGSTVALFDPEDDFLRWRWTAYFLPAYDVAASKDIEVAKARYVVASGRQRPPSGTRVLGGRGCGVYQLR